MLDTLRQGAQSWVSKLLMGILVISFGIWGIAGSVQGYGTSTVATVGGESVTVPEFARAQEQYQRSAQASGREVNPDQVLQQLLLGAALDDEARGFNLGISDDRIAREAVESIGAGWKIDAR